jgi:hypothetical protein
MKTEQPIKAYKGFNQDMTCRGFQYKEGETYEMQDNAIRCCEQGFHACENPIDILGYYEPSSSVYHEVELSGEIDKDSDDSKLCASRIKIGARIDIPKLCKLTFDYVKSHCTNANNPVKGQTATAGDQGAATAGSYGAATAGNRGAATAGYYGAATAGNYGAATAGYYGAATAGNYGAATAGNYGAATAGDQGAATAGNYGAATAGDYGAVTAGNRGAATAGDYGAATAGDYGAATAGNRGAATSRGKSAVGKNGIACARCTNPRAKGDLGAVLVLVEEKEDDYDIANWKAVVVDGKDIKPNTWYELSDGELRVVNDNENEDNDED